MSVGMVYDPIYLKHDTGTHMENAGRLTSIIDSLRQNGFSSKIVQIPSRAATFEEITLVHHPAHVRRIENLSKTGGCNIDSDTMVSSGSYDAAIFAAGGAIRALDAVMNQNVESAFALVRPPGHHATADRAMGFCLFNNISIAAAYGLLNYRLPRIAIIDFDVHHGNGTQVIFYNDPRVLFSSVHQFPYYPGTGNIEDIGSGRAEGTKVNVPIPGGCGDKEYLQVFREIVAPAVRRFKPQLILVSAGYDAHWADSISSMMVSTSGFAEIVGIIKKLAEESCGGRLVLVLEGGYHLEALSASVKATFQVLLAHDRIEDPLGCCPARFKCPDIGPRIQTIRRIHSLA